MLNLTQLGIWWQIVEQPKKCDWTFLSTKHSLSSSLGSAIVPILCYLASIGDPSDGGVWLVGVFYTF